MDSFFKRSGPPRGRGQGNPRDLRGAAAGRVEKPKESRPFDKKTYRMKKYSNKYKLEKWENTRRKTVLKNYYKQVKNDPNAGKYTAFKFDENDKIGSDAESDAEEPQQQQPAKEDAEPKIHYAMHPDLLEKLEKQQSASQQSGHSREKRPFQRMKQEMQRLRTAKEAQREAQAKAKQEKEAAIAQYKAKKADKFKKLGRRSRSGQPVMRERMQMLLEAVQRST